MKDAEAVFRDRVKAICTPLPGAVWSDPWGGGHDAWKLNDKMFACIGMQCDGVSVKCADVETAEMLIDSGAAQKARYFHKSWVRLPMDAPLSDLTHRIETSYGIIRRGLTKKAQSQLAPWPKEH